MVGGSKLGILILPQGRALPWGKFWGTRLDAGGRPPGQRVKVGTIASLGDNSGVP